MTTVGLFHLHFKGTGNFTFGAIKKPTYADFLGPQIPIEDSWEKHFVEVDKAPNKFFICPNCGSNDFFDQEIGGKMYKGCNNCGAFFPKKD